MKPFAIILLALALLQLSAAAASDDGSIPPQNRQVRWLASGQLLVQWEQVSHADKTTVMFCKPDNPDLCVPYLDMFNRYPGPRYAILPTEPGAIIRLGEWAYVSGNTWRALSWEPGIAAPQEGVLLPAVRSAP